MAPPADRMLPQIDDSELAARLAPLVQAVVPPERVGRIISQEPRSSGIPGEGSGASGNPTGRRSGDPEILTEPQGSRLSGSPDSRSAGLPESRNSRVPDPLSPGAGAPAQRTKRGVEFLLPDRVVLALKADAAKRGVSASMRLLEILQDAGYPVVREDF